MYEFSDKEIRRQFKQTEYGKKVNKWLYMSLFSIGVAAIISVIVAIIIAFNFSKIDKEFIILIIGFLSVTFWIALIIACYFDGKRDGAIEQFKLGQKKK